MRSQLYTIVCQPGLRRWHTRCHLPKRIQNGFTVTFVGLTGQAFGLTGCEPKEGQTMLWTIFVILLILWLVGVVSSYTIGGFIHLLLVIALVVLLINIISGRRPVV